MLFDIELLVKCAFSMQSIHVLLPSASRYWRHALMIHSRDAIDESLTNLPTAELEKEAVKMFKV